MQSKNIFIGTIKKCKDLYWYEKYGAENYFGDFQICHVEIGTTRNYVDIIAENAILIKVNESKYIWVDSLTNKIEEFLASLGISTNKIGTTPSCDGDLFVDEKTIQPAFKNNKNNLKKEQPKKHKKRYEPYEGSFFCVIIL